MTTAERKVSDMETSSGSKKVKISMRNSSKKIHEILHSDTENIDFNAEDSVDMVNAWVASITNGKITKMVKEFSRNTVLYLANALYFKEEWLVPFEDVNYDETPLREVSRHQQD